MLTIESFEALLLFFLVISSRWDIRRAAEEHTAGSYKHKGSHCLTAFENQLAVPWDSRP